MSKTRSLDVWSEEFCNIMQINNQFREIIRKLCFGLFLIEWLSTKFPGLSADGMYIFLNSVLSFDDDMYIFLILVLCFLMMIHVWGSVDLGHLLCQGSPW